MPRPHFLSLLLIAVTLGLFTAPVPSQSIQGTAFTYQGRLDVSGAPATGSFAMLFRLYREATGTLLVGSAVFIPDVPVVDGLFTVDLDFGHEAFSNEARWLEIRVGPVGSTLTTLSPRRRIRPAPGVIEGAGGGDGHSLDAVDGLPVDALFVDPQGRVGVGTTSPESRFHIAAPAGDDPAPQLLGVARNDGMPFAGLDAAEVLHVDGTTVYVASRDSGSLTIIDATNPASPVLLAELVDGDGTYDSLAGANYVTVADGFAYVTALADDALTIIDVTTPATPSLAAVVRQGLDGITDLIEPSSVLVSGDFAFVGTSTGLTIFDVSDPSNPNLMNVLVDNEGGFVGLLTIRDMVKVGDLLICAASTSDAVTMIDVSDPSQPTPVASLVDGVGEFRDLDGVWSVDTVGDLLYAAAYRDDALSIIDISTPSNPTLINVLRDGSAGFDLLGGAGWIDIDFPYAAVASYNDDALVMLDVSNPRAPQLLYEVADGQDGFDDLHQAYSVALSGGVAYVTAFGDDAVTIAGIENIGGNAMLVEGDAVISGTSTFQGHSTFEGDATISGGTGSARLTLQADVNNDDEAAQPSILMTQDGGVISGEIGFFSGENDFEIKSSGDPNSSIILTPPAFVGINEPDPIAKLDINAGPYHGLRVRNSSSTPWAIRIANDSSTTFEGGIYLTDDGFLRLTNDVRSSPRLYAQLDSSGNWTSTSDERRKTGSAPIADALTKVLNLQPITYFFRDAAGEPTGREQIGVTAQDVETEFPQLVTDNEEFKSLNYSGLGIVAIAALQELKAEKDAEIERLRLESESKDRRLEELEARLARIEAMLGE